LERKLIYPNLVSASFFRTTFGAADFKSQLFNKQFSIYRLFTRNASMNSNYYHLELSISQEAHHDLKPQSSESRKIRGEADAISTQDRFSKFEFSHLFLRCWPVLASPTPGEQKRWRLFSIGTAIIQPKSSMYTSKMNLFSRRSQRKPLQAARMSFEQAKVIYVLFLPFSFIYFYSKYSRRNTLIVRVVNTRRFNSGYTCCNLLFTLSAEPLIGLIDIGIQLEVIQDLPLITDQEYSSHYRRKIRALYAKVHLNLSRKVQPSFNFVYGLWL